MGETQSKPPTSSPHAASAAEPARAAATADTSDADVETIRGYKFTYVRRQENDAAASDAVVQTLRDLPRVKPLLSPIRRSGGPAADTDATDSLRMNEDAMRKLLCSVDWPNRLQCDTLAQRQQTITKRMISTQTGYAHVHARAKEREDSVGVLDAELSHMGELHQQLSSTMEAAQRLVLAVESLRTLLPVELAPPPFALAHSQSRRNSLTRETMGSDAALDTSSVVLGIDHAQTLPAGINASDAVSGDAEAGPTTSVSEAGHVTGVPEAGHTTGVSEVSHAGQNQG